MTVTSSLATNSLAWTGVESAFNPGFQAAQVGDVAVSYSTPGGLIALTLNVHYTAALDSANNWTAAPTSALTALAIAPATLIFARNSSPLQSTGYVDGAPVPTSQTGRDLDLIALRDQELRRDVSALQAQLAAAIVNASSTWAATLPSSLPAASGVLWNNNGTICLS